MPDLPISGLPVVTIPSTSYAVAAVSASVTSQMTLAQVAAAISSSFTASQAVSASYATSASYEINYETSSSYADTASFVTASNVYGPFGSNSILSASYAVSASYAPFQVSASYATTASYAESSSYALSASYALTSVSASYAISSSNAESSSYATSASYADTASIAVSSSYAITASHALSAMTTGSSTGNTLTFTKGDGSTFNLYITPGGAFPVNYGLFNQTGSSTPVLGTTPSGSLLAGGVGTLSVPANGFAVGDAFTVTMFGNLTSNNGHGLEIVVSSNGTALVDTNTITMPGVTDQGWKLDVNFTINKIGGAGVASIASAGLFTFRTNSSGDVVTEIFSTVNNTTFDTTTGNTLDIRAIWTGAIGSDSIYSNLATLNKTY